MGKLGCISSLFTCFSSSKKGKDGVAGSREAPGTATTNGRNGRVNGSSSNGEQRRVSIKGENLPHRMQSPLSSDILSIASGTSGRSSIYFDAERGASIDWHSVNGDGSVDEFDEFFTLQIDGQYFFNAKDDPTISNEAFEGIQMYPPLPTTEPDPIPRSPISVSNMQTLLRDYQQSGEEEDTYDEVGEKKIDAEAVAAASAAADAATEKAGMALEHQAKRLMSIDRATAEYLGESTNLLLKELNSQSVREKGFPGELTPKELEAVKQFQSELNTRDPIYKQIVRSLSAVEKEAYALCRFLRARKFDVEKVFELLDEARPHYAKAQENKFYLDLEAELGFSRSVFLSQYPAVFSGNAKNGCPVMYMKLGSVQPEGIKCIVSLEKVDRFFWNDITYVFPNVLKTGRVVNPDFARTENITVYDLKGVSRSQVTSDTFEMIKVGNAVMSSFPETLHCLLIINAPSWFGLIWSLVKKMIDARTASKIEVFTSAKSGDKRMQELIDKNQIPSDYGGTGPSLATAASGGAFLDDSGRGGNNAMVVLNQLLSTTKRQMEKSHDFELDEGKELMLKVYTRCKSGATVVLSRGGGEKVTEVDVIGDTDDEPYSTTIETIKGPGSFTVKVKARLEPGVFLVLGTTLASN